MIARRNEPVVHTRYGVLLSAAAALLFASCGNAAQFVAIVARKSTKAARTPENPVSAINATTTM